MWTCPACGEMHTDHFKECWKCASAEQSPHITAAEPKLVPPPAPAPLRTTGSIVIRVVIGFVIGVIAGMAIFHRSGVEIEAAATYGLYLGGGLALIVGIYLWILFPYQPSKDTPPATIDDLETNDLPDQTG